MDLREKLIELIGDHKFASIFPLKEQYSLHTIAKLADHLIENGVTVQDHGKWINKEIDEMNLHVYGNCSVCHERKRIDNFCPHCGVKMDLPEPPKGD